MPFMSRMRRAVAGLVLALFLGAETGCSWIFMKKEPPLPLEPVPVAECTSSRTAPTVDTILAVATGLTAGLGLVVGLGGAWMQTYEYANEVAVGTWLAIGTAALAATLPLAFSASYGGRHARECERLKGLQAACAAGDQDACTQLRGAQPGPAETPGPSPTESWLREAAGLSAARLSPPGSSCPPFTASFDAMSSSSRP